MKAIRSSRSNLSGYSYSMLPVAARFFSKGVDITRRWSYFTELDLGLEVRVTDSQSGESRGWGLGLTALTALTER